MSLTRKNFLTLFCSVIIAIVMAEVLLGFVPSASVKSPYQPVFNWVHRSGYYSYPSDTTIYFVNEINDKVSIKTDSFGFRNDKSQLVSSDALLCGDSFIAAANTKDDETLTFFLRQKKVKVYNCGVDGFSTFDSINAIRDLTNHIKVNTVILAFYLGNDLRDNFGAKNLFFREYAVKELNIKRETFLGRFKSYLAGSNISVKIYQPIKNKFFPKTNPDILMNSYALGQIFSLENTPNILMTESILKTKLAFEELANLSRARNFRVIVVGIPSKAQVYESFKEVEQYDIDSRSKQASLDAIHNGFSFDNPDFIISKISASHHFSYVSLLKPFRESKHKKLYFYIDSHWTKNGQKLAAEHISANMDVSQGNQ